MHETFPENAAMVHFSLLCDSRFGFRRNNFSGHIEIWSEIVSVSKEQREETKNKKRREQLTI